MPDPMEIIRVTRVSPFTGETNEMTLPISEATFEECSAKCEYMLIQEAFPMLDADQREFIKTGITPDEWI